MIVSEVACANGKGINKPSNMTPNFTKKKISKNDAKIDHIFSDEKSSNNRPMERPMVEPVLQIFEIGVRFAAERSLNETKNHYLRERGGHTHLEA